jgi:hypothetical protein
VFSLADFKADLLVFKEGANASPRWTFSSFGPVTVYQTVQLPLTIILGQPVQVTNL